MPANLLYALLNSPPKTKNIPMKTAIFLLALIAATPTLAQTPDARIPAAPVAVAAPAPSNWEFAPDFLRDQTRISWSAPNANGAGKFFVTTTDSAGIPTGEVVNLLSKTGKNWGTLTATFDKKGRLKDQVMDGLLGAMSLGNSDSQANMTLSDVVVKTNAKKGSISKRTFTLTFPSLTGALVCTYDARGRRARDVFTPTVGAARTINYVYDARGLSQIGDGATTTTIERDANGKMRALSAIQSGLLTRSATPLKNDKGAIIGTRIEDYSGGILSEVNEITREGGQPNRTSETSSSNVTTDANGQQTTENKFEFRVDINPPKTPAVAAVEVRTHSVYKNAKISSEEIYRDGILTRRSEFNANGVIEKLTDFNADGSVASELDSRAIPYADGSKGIVPRSAP